MYCSECGQKIPDDSIYCPECGAKLEGAPYNACYHSSGYGLKETIQKMTTRQKIICGCVSAGIVIGILALNAKPTISLDKYVTVSFDGYNTIGTATVTLDEEQLKKDYGSKIKTKQPKSHKSWKIWKWAKKNKSKNSIDDLISDCIAGSLNKDSGLSNGDIVSYVWDCNADLALEKYGCNLKYTDLSFSVTDLVEAETFDPFDGITVNFDGIAPHGYAYFDGTPVAAAAENLNYIADKEDNLSNDDVVTISIDMGDTDPAIYCAEHYGVIPSPLSKTFTVSGLNSYISDISEISQDDLKEMKEVAKDLYFDSNLSTLNEGEALSENTYIGQYFIHQKNPLDSHDLNNISYLIYETKIHNQFTNENGSYDNINTVYWFVAYKNLLLDTNNKIIFDPNDCIKPRSHVTFDSGLNRNWWYRVTWRYEGYESLDALKNDILNGMYDAYTYEFVDANNHDTDVLSESEEEIEETNFSTQEERALNESGEIFPDSATVILDDGEINTLSDENLRYAINEIYARHGYIFKDSGLQAHYSQFSWYQPTIDSSSFSMDIFNTTEKSNLEKLQAERDRRK